MKANQVAAASTKELLAFYNQHAEKPVAKFADRKTAERRVRAIIEAMPVADGACPLCGGDASSQTANGPEGTVKGDRECFCHECGGAYDRASGKRRQPHGEAAGSALRSAAIAATWKDPAVAAARARRMAVKADGAEFKSVPAAFRALGLPMSRAIRFRGQLRDAGKLAFEHDGKTVKFELSE